MSAVIGPILRTRGDPRMPGVGVLVIAGLRLASHRRSSCSDSARPGRHDAPEPCAHA